MSLLTTVLRAAHCRSTHHYFVVDSTEFLDTEAGQRLGSVLLKHHERFLTGAKDPDDRFRDFQNHCVHVRDGYWGGAPRLAVSWYERLKDYLLRGQYADAAYAAGVFSHYFTDPLQPLHTAQSDREAIVHRAMEWSVRCSYQAIFDRWKQDELRAVFVLGDGETWLPEAIYQGARFANRSYERLIDTYDLQRGSKNPPDGLDDAARETYAALFGLAITGLARVWERVAAEVEAESGTQIPHQSLSFTALLATLQIPERVLVGRIEDKRERQAIELIFDEYRRTGDVVEHMPAECYVKRQVWSVYQREMQWHQQLTASVTAATIGHICDGEAAHGIAVSTSAVPVVTAAEIAADVESDVLQPATLSFVDAQQRQAGKIARSRLWREDALVDAPSIGPKTAARFAEIGIHLVGEFLDEDSSSLAVRLETRWITASLVSDWQAQAQLMCLIPGLLARDTQLLVGAGYRTSARVQAADATTLYQAICRFAATADGRRALRNSVVPEFATVRQWTETQPPAVTATETPTERRRAA